MDTSRNGRIDYLEFPAANLAATRTFFESVFGWEFQEWGAEYISFKDGGMNGGFYASPQASRTESGGALIVLYHSDLAGIFKDVVDAGGEITRDVFTFPGGRRFHFLEPSGNELAIWSE